MFSGNCLFANTVTCLIVLLAVTLTWGFVQFHRVARRRTSAEKLHDGLNALCESDTAVVSVMRCEGAFAICVIDEWTQYSERCFIQGNLEAAVDDALRSRTNASQGS